MDKGKIKNTYEVGFGFIKTDTKDVFFHRTDYEGQFDDLRRGQSVTFVEGVGANGRPIAKNVQLEVKAA